MSCEVAGKLADAFTVWRHDRGSQYVNVYGSCVIVFAGIVAIR
ncbi:hypothetical protein DFJ67_5246 [Asanoa ferruginea]|uniref:Uncharacterized protein n=1 Tax=Asanoa ferruginea TaxID=53367 RepID=A0A3D9ZQR4_9ACTN|nr:hypothetical protein DFJ67_5246 [Asanoa ferruginea]